MEVGYQVGQVVPRESIDLQQQWLNHVEQFRGARDAGFLQRARRAAQSWGNKEALAVFDELESVRKQIYGRTYAEQWAINASVHYNNWENMSHEDFSPVVDAFRDMNSLFLCSSCGGMLEKLPRKGPLEVVKCPCGKVNWNLKQKQAS